MDSIPVIREKKGISPIWILPIIALCICAWILYTSYQNAGVKITVFFEDASGITPGKTQVITRGIPIGTVLDVKPDIESRKIKTVIAMDKAVTDYLVEDTRFWVVRPEISVASVQGLDTLFSGSYIGIEPGHSTTTVSEFAGLASPPPISAETPGLHLRLRAKALGSLQIGASIYYRNIAIGSITRYSLEENEDILLNLYIEQQYAHLVREGSRFYNSSGLSISGKITDLKIQVESLASLIKGGIVLHTPEALAGTPLVKNGHLFDLYKDLESARYGLNMTLKLASSAGITEGETKVMYRGFVAGIVEKIELNEDERNTVTAYIMLDPRAGRILRQETQFWIVQPSITTEGVRNIETLLSGPHITFKPGSGHFQNHFEILPAPPPQSPLRAGSELLLTASESYSIQKGAPVSYKSKKVGEVLDVELDAQLENFEILIFIYEQYEKLVKPHSVFWSSGGMTVDAGFSGIRVQADSLGSVLSGGVAFISPDTLADTETETQNTIVFPVYKTFADAVATIPALQPEGYHFALQAEDPDIFAEGTPIYYKKVKVGYVTGFQLASDHSRVLINCFIEKKYSSTLTTTSRFYSVSGLSVEGSLAGVSLQTTSLQSIVTGGIGFFTPEGGLPPRKSMTFPLYNSRKDAQSVDNVIITVRFKESKDLHKGSEVKYRGITIGEVKDIFFAEDMHDIVADLSIDRKAAPFFRRDTRIWLENVEVSLSGVRNLKSTLFGPYITILPGEGPPQQSFFALAEPPAQPVTTAGGLNIILSASHLGSLQIGSPLTYRQLKIGKVIDYKLSQDFNRVLIRVNIALPFVPLIRDTSRFWFASGTRIEGGLFSGITFSMESLEALLTGGIALATPGKESFGSPVGENHLFTLHDEAKSEWLAWEPHISVPVKK